MSAGECILIGLAVAFIGIWYAAGCRAAEKREDAERAKHNKKT